PWRGDQAGAAGRAGAVGRGKEGGGRGAGAGSGGWAVMAGDWIKMRSELQSHPKVVRILSAMRPHDVQNATDKFRVIGGLHAAWSVFDTHSTDGVLFGYTPDLLNHVIGWPGFAEAMIAVDWLSFDGRETLTLPEFDEHNSQSAKRRAEDQKRKRDGRKC